MRTLVPVSGAHAATSAAPTTTSVSAMFAELPVGIADPIERLGADPRADGQDLKESKQAVAGEVLTSLTGFAPPMLLALGARVAAPLAAAQRQHGDDQRARARSSRSTPAAGGCSRHSRTSRSAAPSASASRSSPTTAT